jgi:hypothetical protein
MDPVLLIALSLPAKLLQLNTYRGRIGEWEYDCGSGLAVGTGKKKCQLLCDVLQGCNRIGAYIRWGKSYSSLEVQYIVEVAIHRPTKPVELLTFKVYPGTGNIVWEPNEVPRS